MRTTRRAGVGAKGGSLAGLLVAIVVAIAVLLINGGAFSGGDGSPSEAAPTQATPTQGTWTGPPATTPATTPAPTTAAGHIAASALPPEARATLALIDAGGPYPYRQDDGVFGNREGLLPSKPRGFYREYTVETPGSRDRGARRIVVGGAADARIFYYTDDHYDSFRVIDR